MFRTSSETRSASRKKGHRFSRWVAGSAFLIAALAGVVATLLVPRGEPVAPPDSLAQAVQRGPDSYFHHFFDPDHFFGEIGHWDLELDTFQRLNSHGVLFAAFPSAPPDIAGFTMRTAETWAPGVKGADNGMILFVFPNDRRIRVEVGYGLESALPDVEVRRLVERFLVPALRAGDAFAGVEAIVPPLLERLQAVPPATATVRTGLLATILLSAQQIPKKLALVRSAWLANPPGPRLILSALGAALVAILALLLAQIVRSVVLLVRRFRVRRDVSARLGATADVVSSILQLGQVLLILFVMMTGDSLFFPGTGGFGGAGIDFIW